MYADVQEEEEEERCIENEALSMFSIFTVRLHVSWTFKYSDVKLK